MKISPSSIAPRAQQAVAAAPQDPLKQEILCPVLGSLVHEGKLHADAAGNVSLADLTKALRSVGTSMPATAMLVAAAPVANSSGEVLHNLLNMSFNVYKLRGGAIQHPGDTGILTAGKFDEQKFQTLISHSKDGKTLTLADLSAAGADSAARDGLKKTAPLEYAELGAAIAGFGFVDAAGTRRVEISALRDIFQHKVLPPQKDVALGVVDMVGIMARMAMAAPSSASGLSQKSLGDALGKAGSPAPANLQGLKLAMCPAMGSGGAQKMTATPNSPDETARLHSAQ